MGKNTTYYSSIEECKKINPEFTGKHAHNWIDLTGQTFNNWTVLYYTQDSKVACQCKCGKIKILQPYNIKSGKSKSCGCLNLLVNDLTGQRFGKLTVEKLVPAPRNINQRGAWWHCKCDCGGEIDVIAKSLTSGSTKSCGCLQTETSHNTIMQYNLSEKNRVDLTGQHFGRLTAVYPTEKREGGHIIWACLCECGNVHLASANNLKKGFVKSCGCLNSVQEGVITNLLQDNGISFNSHFGIKIEHFNKMFFDFQILLPDNKFYFIEFDGSQHFKGYGEKQSILDIRKRDLIKNKYCFDNNIPLIRIPYDADYTIDDLKLKTTRFLLTPENEEKYYKTRTTEKISNED